MSEAAKLRRAPRESASTSRQPAPRGTTAPVRRRPPQALLQRRSQFGPAHHRLILDLQRTAGNRATTTILAGPVSVQRTNGKSSKVNKSLTLIQGRLADLAAFENEFIILAKDLPLLRELALAYGFSLDVVDPRRANEVPKDLQRLVEAGIQLKNWRSFIREWVEDLGKKTIKKKLKKKHRRLLEAFLAAASHYDMVYSTESPDYLTKSKVGEEDPQPVYEAEKR